MAKTSFNMYPGTPGVEATERDLINRKYAPTKPFLEIRVKCGLSGQIYVYNVQKPSSDTSKTREEVFTALEAILEKALPPKNN